MTQSSYQMNTSVQGPGCLVRVLYFIFIGWWFGLIWILGAWFFNLTIIGLPLGLAMINSIPQVMTLRPVRVQTTVVVKDGAPVLRQTAVEQHPFLLRAIYFLVIGWWFSAIWLGRSARICGWVLSQWSAMSMRRGNQTPAWPAA